MRPSLVEVPRALDACGLALRALERGDGPALFDAVDRSRDQLRPWVPWVDQHARPEDSEAFAREASARFTLREALTYGIFEPGGGIVGGAGLHRIDLDAGRCEVGYWVRTDRHRRGIATSAAKVMLTLAFRALRAERVEMCVDSRNTASAAIPRSLGLVHEGTRRRDALAVDGTHRDTMLFSMLPHEFVEAPWSPGVTLRQTA